MKIWLRRVFPFEHKFCGQIKSMFAVFQYLINYIINMPLQYIYTGYSKCGTKTMAEVFRVLGFKVCDFEETMLDLTTDWIEFIDGRKTHEERIELLKQMFQDFDACMGAPCYVYWQELMAAFPDAKCIFYQREEHSWAKSCVTQLEKPFKSYPGKLPDWIHTILYSRFYITWPVLKAVF